MTSPTSKGAHPAPPPDSVLADLGDEIVQLARHLQRGAHERSGAVPLTGTEVMVLRYVDHHPGAGPSAVAEGLGLRRPNLSAALRGLESKGMLARRPDPEDSRATRLELTDRAAESNRRIREHWGRELSARLGTLTDHEQEALARAVAILARADQAVT
ncbi:MarR family transcriptional regulator [Brachybacterium sp. NBEC-018]|uniref:MarR family winged helix-turn-helix transcriptional regulator n=1 Tax=Brachybacterium sp. NBEC-018 TaxID=2996004 RepID=UPI0021755B7B|nr:MarR family transcriptional regulator [Brachybacterium sp. NBEC-018]UVY83627.1 MarR family transcriptional regulator [Brachybacterium sp. NBEC-018]